MSKFQQWHYEAIAGITQEVLEANEMRNWSADEAITYYMLRLTDLFQGDNGMFDRGRFERACQPGANVKARTR